MLNLVLKDFLVQKKTFFIAIGYCVFFFMVFQQAASSGLAYIIAPFAIGYIYIMYTGQFDDKNKSDIILNSLPVTRQEIVVSRFIFYFAVVCLGFFITAVVGAVFKLFLGLSHLRYISPQDFVAAFSLIGIMASIHTPLYYKFGMNVRYFDMFLFLSFFFVPNYLVSYIKQHPDTPLLNFLMNLNKYGSDWTMGLFAIAVTLAVMTVSMAISIRIYGNKDF